MALPTFTMKQLMEAGVHFGHHTRRWNPLMTPYVYGVKDKIHIINLNKTAPLLHRSLVALEAIAAAGGKVLFVATKHQAKDIVKDAAERCGQYYVNNRWLGGMLTNWTTVSQSIRRLKKMEADIANAEKLGLTKKEVGVMTKEVEKLRDIFGGILDMHGVPQAMVVIDVPREMNAVREAKNLDIPTIAICDTNAIQKWLTIQSQVMMTQHVQHSCTVTCSLMQSCLVLKNVWAAQQVRRLNLICVQMQQMI